MATPPDDDEPMKAPDSPAQLGVPIHGPSNPSTGRAPFLSPGIEEPRIDPRTADCSPTTTPETFGRSATGSSPCSSGWPSSSTPKPRACCRSGPEHTPPRMPFPGSSDDPAADRDQEANPLPSTSAWARVLRVSRAVFEGVHAPILELPALGPLRPGDVSVPRGTRARYLGKR